MRPLCAPRRRLKICCSESNPAWLLVDLGAQRPIAALSVTNSGSDITYSIALGISSAGPWRTVGRAVCVFCLPEMCAYIPTRTHALTSAASASHVLLTVTWSSDGGVGGCADLCDFAAKISSLRAWSPGAMPSQLDRGAVPWQQTVYVNATTCASWPAKSLISTQSATGAGVSLSGAATLGPVVSTAAEGGTAPAMSDSRAVLLNAPEQTSALGAAEFTRVIDPAVDCPYAAGESHSLGVTAFVRIGGGTWPGEGFVLSIVDA